MIKWRGPVSVACLVLGVAIAGSGARAQEPSEPTPSPDAPQAEKKGLGLFLAVGAGKADADDLNTSIQTSVTDVADSTLSLDDQDHARAAIGWKFPDGKGAFRVVFNGYKEDAFEFDSVGRLNRTFNEADLSQPALMDCVDEDDDGQCEQDALATWWTMRIRDGQLLSERSSPTFNPTEYLRDPNTQEIIFDGDGNCTVLVQGDDDDCDNLADQTEIRFLPVDRTITRTVADTLQNQVQTVDLIYGREFGGRRFSSRWWAGLRYFEYQGNVLATAWLTPNSLGTGFTDGSFLPPLSLFQDASGFGPTGSWEVDFNFFNKGVVLYMRGQSAFTFNSISIDSGDFLTLVNDPQSGLTFSAQARLQEDQDKSSWQNTGEIGGRIVLRNGLEFEFAYSITGYLDVVMLPSDITVPNTVGQVDQNVSAQYNTQDYILTGWTATMGFQF